MVRFIVRVVWTIWGDTKWWTLLLVSLLCLSMRQMLRLRPSWILLKSERSSIRTIDDRCSLNLWSVDNQRNFFLPHWALLAPLASIPPTTAPRSTALFPIPTPFLALAWCPGWTCLFSVIFALKVREVSCPFKLGARRALRLILSCWVWGPKVFKR